MRKVLCITTVCLLIVTFFSGCGILQKLGFLKNNEEAQPASSLVMNEEEAKKLSDKVPIHLYFANEDNSKLKLVVRYIPMEEAKKSVNNLASTIVKELVKGPGTENGLKSTIPAGVSLRGPISVNAGVATVDFTKEFVDKHPGGKEAAQMTIYSVVNSLTELKEVQKVKFTINGKTQSDFKGVFKFDTEFPRSVNLISNVPNIQKTNTPAPTKQPAAPTKQPDIKKDNKSQPVNTPNPKAAETDKETSGILNAEENYLENLE